MRGRPRQRQGIAVALVLAAAIFSPPAWAQTTLSGERGTPLVPEADTVPAGEFSLSAAVSALGGRPGDRFHAAPFGLTLGLWDRLEASVSLQAMPRGLLEARGVEQDLRLSTKALLLTEYFARPAISLALAADHPLQGWDFLPSVITHKHVGPLLLTGQFGWRLPRVQRDADPPGPFYGGAAALAMSPSLTLLLQAAGDAGRGFANVKVMPGIAFSLLGPDPLEARRKALRQKALEVARAILGDAPLPEVTTTLQAAAAADAAAGPPAWTGIGLFNSARTALLQHPGRITFFATGGLAFGDRATWSVIAGIQIASFDELLQDSDGDGIPDRFDKCPYEPEDWDGYEDEDGCPDNGIEVLKKLAEEARRKVEKTGVRFTTPFPRYRMRIPIRQIPAAPARGDPRESDPPRALPVPPATPPVEKRPENAAPSRDTRPSVPAAGPGQSRATVPAAGPGQSASVAARVALRKGLDARPAPDSAAAHAPGTTWLPGLLRPSARSGAPTGSPAVGFSPVVPRSILSGPDRAAHPVRDALWIPGARAASSSLSIPYREGLAQFAVRAAGTQLELEVWGCAQSWSELDAAGMQAREIALLATQLGNLPAGRAHALPSLRTRTSGVIVLLVPAAGAPR